jgi:hypothetical protein
VPAEAVARWREQALACKEAVVQRKGGDPQLTATPSSVSGLALAALPPEPFAAEVLTWFLRRFLSAPDPRFQSSLLAFRVGYVDDHDDIRLHALAAVAALVREKRHMEESRGGGANRLPYVLEDATEPSLVLLRAVPEGVFLSHCAAFLAGVALPAAEVQWQTMALVNTDDDAEEEARKDEAQRTAEAENPFFRHAKTGWFRQHWAERVPLLYHGLALVTVPLPAGAAPSSSASSALPQQKQPKRKARKTVFLMPEYGLYLPQRSAFTKAWFALADGISAVTRTLATASGPDAVSAAGQVRDASKRFLAALPTQVLPVMGKGALQFADFLGSCLDGRADTLGDGSLAVLALQPLFSLMVNQGLEYPRFYPRLYDIVGSAAALHSKYRGRLFKGLDLFLSSPILPAYLVAAFAKRLLAMAMHHPASVGLFALALAYNLVKRHPAITPILQRSAASAILPQNAGTVAGDKRWPLPADPYVEDLLTAPLPTAEAEDEDRQAGAEAGQPRIGHGALYSSLWEASTLQQHYLARVVHLARALTRQPTKEEHDIAGTGEFAEATYAQLIGQELDRTVRKGGEDVAPDIFFAFAPIATAVVGVAPGSAPVNAVLQHKKTFESLFATE